MRSETIKELLLEFKKPVEEILEIVNRLLELIYKKEKGEDVEKEILQETGRFAITLVKMKEMSFDINVKETM